MKLLLILATLLFCLQLDVFAWDIEVQPFTSFENNGIDTHMMWDGQYIWIPESETVDCPFATGDITSNNLIMYDTAKSPSEAVVYDLPTPPDPNRVIVYEAINGVIDTSIVYVGAPYHSDEQGIYIVDKDDENSAVLYTPPNIFYSNGNGGGAKMTVEAVGGVDYVWCTGTMGRIIRFDTSKPSSDNNTVHKMYDVSGGFNFMYGIENTPTSDPDIDIIHVSNKEQLLIFPSNLATTAVADMDSINFKEQLSLSSFTLTDMTYDGKYIWVSGENTSKQYLIKYTPADVGVVGDYVVYELPTYIGLIPSVVDFKNHIYITHEQLIIPNCVYPSVQDTSRPQLTVFNKSTEVMETIQLGPYVGLERAAAGMSHDEDFIYVGGYGYTDLGKNMSLLKVTPQFNTSFSEVTTSGVIIN